MRLAHVSSRRKAGQKGEAQVEFLPEFAPSTPPPPRLDSEGRCVLSRVSHSLAPAAKQTFACPRWPPRKPAISSREGGEKKGVEEEAAGVTNKESSPLFSATVQP